MKIWYELYACACARDMLISYNTQQARQRRNGRLNPRAKRRAESLPEGVAVGQRVNKRQRKPAGPAAVVEVESPRITHSNPAPLPTPSQQALGRLEEVRNALLDFEDEFKAKHGCNPKSSDAPSRIVELFREFRMLKSLEAE